MHTWRVFKSTKLSFARVLRLVFWPIFLLGITSCTISHAIRIDDGQRIGVEQMIAEVSNSPVVFVGEQHDVAAHHALQLDVIKGLHKTGKPLAIGVEMFVIDSQPALDNWIAGKIPEEKFVRVYQANWRNLKWGLYQEIFLFARDHGIPMVALNVPQQIVEKVAREGFLALSKTDLRALPAESTVPLTEENFQFMTAHYPGHGKNSESFRHLCEAQALRNRVMAKTITRYLAHHPESSMVVLAGGAHAWSRGGIPAELGELPYKVIIPPLPSAVELRGGADYLLD
jgi:uncharacterized iron-regulated protein